jgi:ABC-2 type transport system permease protein
VSAFVGSGLMVRLLLRRDRVRLAVWIVGIWLVVVPSIATFPGLYQEQRAIDLRNDLLMSNPVGIAVTGPGYGLEEATPENLGPMAVNEMSGSTIIAMALMGILLMLRYTRGDEEEGRLELMRAGVVGRFAPVTAAMLVVSAAMGILGVTMALGLVALGYAAAGSFALGLSMAAGGIAFAAIGALAAQLTEHARAASALAMGTFAVLFFVRVIGDVRGNAAIWFSPAGWVQSVRPFADERWWVLALPLAFALALVGLAFALTVRRDVGAGLLPTRPGRARATTFLTRPLGLALRLQRGPLLWWALGMGAFGAAIGGLATEAQQTMEALDIYAEYFAATAGGTLVEQFLSAYLGFIAMTGIGHALQSAVLIRAEEGRGRAEPLLAGAVSRGRWVGGFALATLIASTIVLGAAGAGAGASFAAATGDGAGFLRVLGAMLAYAPAVWLLPALALALFGVAYRWLGVVWGGLAWVITIAMLGPLMGLPAFTRQWTPFAHTPQMPAQDFEATPLLVMSAAIVVMAAIGFVGFRRRDVDLH